MARESSGKTTLAIHAIAEAQKRGGIAAMIDAEHAFDRFYAQQLGVDINNLLISQPDNRRTGARDRRAADTVVGSGYTSWWTLWQLLRPKSEIEGEMGDRNMGLQARLIDRPCASLPEP